ncbi:hypothetical protein ACJ73_06559 [Blastomyces percursus]|uniref:Uncharacterized protein n=1 Tax=Blastomyces percursus TaxID=1658174 RepID=A0A1J9QPI5_9EURO|nr:hypothetical protein ACJ73_06559 [Blastomyces percursus]
MGRSKMGSYMALWTMKVPLDITVPPENDERRHGGFGVAAPKRPPSSAALQD